MCFTAQIAGGDASEELLLLLLGEGVGAGAVGGGGLAHAGERTLDMRGRGCRARTGAAKRTRAAGGCSGQRWTRMLTNSAYAVIHSTIRSTIHSSSTALFFVSSHPARQPTTQTPRPSPFRVSRPSVHPQPLRHLPHKLSPCHPRHRRAWRRHPREQLQRPPRPESLQQAIPM